MKTILLVEDDPFLIDIYVNQLKKEGFKVLVAQDGQAGLKKIQTHYPDLVLLDILLPKMSGWDLLKAVRSDEKTKDTKVIVISNLDQKDCTENIANLKVLKYFLKIATAPDEITHAIKEILT